MSAIARLFTLILILTLALMTAGPNTGAARPAQAQEDDPIPEGGEDILLPVWQALSAIKRGYMDPEGDVITTEMLINGALHGMVAVLDEPYSEYLEPQPLEDLTMRVAGETVGLGVRIDTVDDTGEIYVIEVLADSPAEEAGVQVNDVFFAIDGEEVAGLDQEALIARSRGPEGSEVTLTMRRGEELIDITVVRGRIPDRLVNARLLDNGIGYVHLLRFSSLTQPQLLAALEDLDVDSLNGLIIDVRNNPGGAAGPTVDVASLFIEEGPIFFEQFPEREVVFDARDGYLGLDIPMAVLMDRRTQSAAEVFAAAMRHYGVATLVGETTFGKGIVQHVENLANGGGVRLTIARILTAGREPYHQVGIIPDLPIPLSDEEGDEQAQAAAAFLTVLSRELNR